MQDALFVSGALFQNHKLSAKLSLAQLVNENMNEINAKKTLKFCFVKTDPVFKFNANVLVYKVRSVAVKSGS